MKKIISIITALILCMAVCANISAEKFRGERKLQYRSGLSEKTAVAYVKEYSRDIEKYLRNKISETAYYSTDEISGEIKIGYPFSFALINNCDKKIHDGSNYMKYFPIINNNNVIGLMEIRGYSYEYTDVSSYIPICENAHRNINEGFSYCIYTPQMLEAGTVGGLAVDWYIFITPDNKASLAYFDSSILYDSSDRTEYLDRFTKEKEFPSFEQVSKYNFINSDTEIIHSFEYFPESEKNITDGDPFYISCSDRYLTYSDGKLALSEYSGSDNQKFILSRQESGCYSIAPSNAPDRKIKVGGTDEFKINLAYLNEYCYCVSKPGDGLTMTAKGNGIVFAKYNSSKYNLSDQKWIIKKTEK